MINEKWRMLRASDLVQWLQGRGVISAIVGDCALIYQRADADRKWYEPCVILAEWHEVVPLSQILKVAWREKIMLAVDDIPTPGVGDFVRFNVGSNAKSGVILLASDAGEFGNVRDCVYRVQVQTGRKLVYTVTHSAIVPHSVTSARSASARGAGVTGGKAGRPEGQRGVPSARYGALGD